jgi:hypothetical protein
VNEGGVDDAIRLRGGFTKQVVLAELSNMGLCTHFLELLGARRTGRQSAHAVACGK